MYVYVCMYKDMVAYKRFPLTVVQVPAYACMYVCMYVYSIVDKNNMYLHTHTYTYTHTHARSHTHVYIYVHTYPKANLSSASRAIPLIVDKNSALIGISSALTSTPYVCMHVRMYVYVRVCIMEFPQH